MAIVDRCDRTSSNAKSIRISLHDSTTKMSHILKCHPTQKSSLQALRHFSPYRYRSSRSSHFSSRRAERGPLAAGYRKNIALRKIPIPIHLSRLNLQLHSLHSHTTPNNSHTDTMAELTHPTIKDGKILPGQKNTAMARLGIVAALAKQSLTYLALQAGSARSATCGLARP